MRKDLLDRISALAVCIAVVAETFTITSCDKSEAVDTKPADYGSYGADIAREIATRFPDRSAYSSGEQATGEYIESQIKELGFETEVQTFYSPEGGQSANYIVKIEGTGFYCLQDNGVYSIEHRVAVIGTHYDAALSPEYIEEENEEESEEEESEEPAYVFDGISDNASGTACVLTALKAFKDYKDVAFDVWFVFFGAGTAEQAGSEFFCQSLSSEELGSIDVMFDVDSLYAGDKVYASSGYSSLLPNKRYAMRRKTYQTYDTCFENTLMTNYGFDLLTNESGVKTDINEDGYNEIFNEVPLTISDYRPFDARLIPVVYIESFDYNFTSIDQMKETKNLSLQDFDGHVRGTPSDCMSYLDSLLVEEDIDKDEDGEIDCSGDRLQIRINCVAFIIDETLLKGSDKGMTLPAYSKYLKESEKQANASETSGT